MAQDANQVSTAVIRSQIARTRAKLGYTVDAIQDRLSPRRIVHDAIETITERTIGRARRLAHHVNEAAHSPNGSPALARLLDKARDNPAVTALVGTAVGALIVAIASRSRRPRLSKSLGGLALSLAMASVAQQRAHR